MALKRAVKMQKMGHYMCHTVITQAVKKKKVCPYLFYFFLIFPSSNMCQVSLQSFNSFQKFSLAIHHQLTFTFVFLHTLCQEKKESTGVGEICLMSYEMNIFFSITSSILLCCSLYCCHLQPYLFFVSFCFH